MIRLHRGEMIWFAALGVGGSLMFAAALSNVTGQIGFGIVALTVVVAKYWPASADPKGQDHLGLAEDRDVND